MSARYDASSPPTDTSPDAPALSRPRICFVVSSPMTAEAFLTHHIVALSERYDVHLVVNAEPAAIENADLRRAVVHRARIERAISPLADAVGMAELWAVLKRGRYAAVHSITPKAGLLTALAAFAARVPVRIHTFTGQVWATEHGIRRALLKNLDRIVARLGTHLLVDSRSQLDFLRQQRVLSADQGEVLGKGSVSGVDAARFRPDAAARATTRAKLDIPVDATVFAFVGRLNRDKGVLDLARAYGTVGAGHEHAYLLLVGPDEEGLASEITQACGTAAPRVRFVGLTEEPERYLAASDIFCLPSYREGFGAVVIEAAAAGLPAIGSRIYGLTDAMEENVTGLLVEPGNGKELEGAMHRLMDDRALRASLAQAARTRALRDFSAQTLTSAMLAFYDRVLSRPDTAGASTL